MKYSISGQDPREKGFLLFLFPPFAREQFSGVVSKVEMLKAKKGFSSTSSSFSELIPLDESFFILRLAIKQRNPAPAEKPFTDDDKTMTNRTYKS